MIPDRELLQRYTQNQDETAFTELVQRHLPAVYAAAFRLGGSNAHLAQDVAQATFTILAQRAQVLTEHATLAGWLHTTTRYLAHKAVREERRRRNREQEAVAMQAQDAVPESNMEPLRPLLDEAVGSLREDERNVLLLRFFHGKSHQEVAATLGLRGGRPGTERMRTLRSIARLAAFLVACRLGAGAAPDTTPQPARPGSAAMAASVRVDLNRRIGEMKPIWRFFGADEPNYATMKNGKALMGELGELRRGEVYFRTHNLLTSGDGKAGSGW